MTFDTFYLIAALALGAIVGSFLNVVILRLPIAAKWVEAGAFLSSGTRSMCPTCGAAIRWFDNLPVLSFVLLGGRSRCCRKPISWLYPSVEILTAALFGWLYVSSPFPVVIHEPIEPGSSFTDEILSVHPGMTAFAFYAAFVALLVASSFIDARFRALPDILDLPGAALGVVGAGVVVGLAGGVALDLETVRWVLIVGAVLWVGLALAEAPPGLDEMEGDDTASEPSADWPELAPPAVRAGRWLGMSGGLLVLAAAYAGGMWLDLALWGVASLPLGWGGRCVFSMVRHRTWRMLGEVYFTDRAGLALTVLAVALGLGVGLLVNEVPAWLLSVRFSLLGVVAAAGFTAALRSVATKLFRRQAMGFGDVKFMGMIGAFVGWEGALVAFFLASLFGAIIGTVLGLVTRDKRVPFGPFLAMGALGALFHQRAFLELAFEEWPRWVQGSSVGPWLLLGLSVLCLFVLLVLVRKGRMADGEQAVSEISAPDEGSDSTVREE